MLAPSKKKLYLESEGLRRIYRESETISWQPGLQKKLWETGKVSEEMGKAPFSSKILKGYAKGVFRYLPRTV